MKKTLFKNSSALLSLMLMSSVSIPAIAQDADDNTDVIYVTGSLIKRPSQENSSSPLNVVTTGDLDAQGLNNVGDLARNMTFNAGAEINTDAFTQNFSTGTSNVNLRNLGLGSTLVLLNGKRQTLSAAYADDGSTFVDTGALMPLIMVDRVETLKDGGSAIYGTDAVSGVVNYITRKNFEGFEIRGGLQQTTSDSQSDYDISAIWGTEAGNGNFVIAGSFLHRTALSAADRPELTSGTGISGSGQPGTIIFRDQIPATDPSQDANLDGRIDLLPIMDPYCGTADLSIQNPLGDPIPTGPTTSITPGSCGFQFDGFYDLVPEDERVQLFTSYDADIGNDMHVYLEAAYSTNKAVRSNAPAFPIASPLPVAVGDGAGAVLPHVPVEIQPLVQSLNLSSVLFVGRALGSNGEPFISNHNNETYRFAGTLDGRVSDTMTWETSVSYSSNTYDINVNDVSRNAYIGALTTGTFNPFGTAWTTHPNSQAALDAIISENTLFGDTSLFTADAHITTELAEIGSSGEMVQLAVGGQYRKSEMNYNWTDGYNGVLGDGSNSVETDINGDPVPFFQGPLAPFNGGNLMFLYGGPDYGGERDVFAGFAELAVPLHETLELQIAARYEDYGDGVNSFDPKFSALWRPNDYLSVRGSYSTAFRAPSIYNTDGVQTSLAEITLGPSSNFIPVTSIGNPDLNPEEAEVINVGFTFRPDDNFRMSMDYWRYDFTNLITQESPQSVLDKALGGNVVAQGKVKLAIANDFSTPYQIITEIINAPSVVTDGFDMSAAYTFDLDLGALTFGAEATYVNKYEGVDQDNVSFEGAGSRNFRTFARSMPEWRANFNVSFSGENHFAHLFLRYIDSYTDDQNDVVVPTYTTVDFQYGYIFGDPDNAPLTATVGVINMFDKDVPRLQTNGGFDSKVHDPRGRMIYMKLSKQF
ncbi:TonB-dependent receptor domain-containing protein [Pseudemcibacter aquimaris]|uniref:TonB-dependent receptor domain-containing protein n=1 Tax=Pseudemcibacter aquimaris TaxID=2857064 RepID=UPI002013BC6F|nr:TonB-dependent receptor [Pseudemcibacter aquimaris]MCC3859826.1 TonB-dependent receptor [Pseudemcibacter aquimaris]WDU57158.1 TonB-dependent receptor [Pseudemcibacter aquimaris]